MRTRYAHAKGPIGGTAALVRNPQSNGLNWRLMPLMGTAVGIAIGVYEVTVVAVMGLAVTTKSAATDMEAFTGKFIDAYYRLIRDNFRKYDHDHMLLGNRWV